MSRRVVHLIAKDDPLRTECGHKRENLKCTDNSEPREELCKVCLSCKKRRESYN